MQLKNAAIELIAQFICGDNPLPFPYRSSSKLTSFFIGLGLDYIHKGESRNAWTRDVIIEINNKSSVADEALSAELISVIEEVMNPDYFVGFDPQNVNYDSALILMNRALKQYKLDIAIDPKSGAARLRSIDSNFVSTAHSSPEIVKKLTFAPKVFEIPLSTVIQHDLVAVMMPFGAAFAPVQKAINQACNFANLRCKRADDIWANSTIIQDIVDLIFIAEIVVVDFTGKNPNVMYETGIAHTLGKHVVPITQSIEHVPFDLQSHRVLQYHPNQEGLAKLIGELSSRLLTIIKGHSWHK